MHVGLRSAGFSAVACRVVAQADAGAGICAKQEVGPLILHPVKV